MKVMIGSIAAMLLVGVSTVSAQETQQRAPAEGILSITNTQNAASRSTNDAPKKGLAALHMPPRVHQKQADQRLTTNEVTEMVLSGALGDELTSRAKAEKERGTLQIREFKPGVLEDRAQFFYYSDYRGGNSILVENGKLVLLASSWGSGPIEGVEVVSRGDKQILEYSYTIGSGILRTIQSEYILGSGRAGLELKQQSPAGDVLKAAPEK